MVFLKSCRHKPCFGLALKNAETFCFCFTAFALRSAYIFECVCSFLYHIESCVQIHIFKCCVLMHDMSSTYRCSLLIASINIILSRIQFSFLFCFSKTNIQIYWLTFLFIIGGLNRFRNIQVQAASTVCVFLSKKLFAKSK